MAFNGVVKLSPEQEAVRRALESRVWRIRISKRRDEWGRLAFIEGDAGLPDYVPGAEDLLGIAIGPVWCWTDFHQAYRCSVMLDLVAKPLPGNPGRITAMCCSEIVAHPTVRGLAVNGPAPSVEADPEPIVVGG